MFLGVKRIFTQHRKMFFILNFKGEKKKKTKINKKDASYINFCKKKKTLYYNVCSFHDSNYYYYYIFYLLCKIAMFALSHVAVIS